MLWQSDVTICGKLSLLTTRLVEIMWWWVQVRQKLFLELKSLNLQFHVFQPNSPKNRTRMTKAPSSSGLACPSPCSFIHTFSRRFWNSCFTSMVAPRCKRPSCRSKGRGWGREAGGKSSSKPCNRGVPSLWAHAPRARSPSTLMSTLSHTQ